MKSFSAAITCDTRGPGLYDITDAVTAALRPAGVTSGLLTCFIRHTSASLTIQENADPAVLSDLNDFFARLVPRGPGPYRHNDEGPDDMPAHIRAALTATALSIPMAKGRLVLGTWQAIYVFEHRDRAHTREVALQLIGE